MIAIWTSVFGGGRIERGCATRTMTGQKTSPYLFTHCVAPGLKEASYMLYSIDTGVYIWGSSFAQLSVLPMRSLHVHRSKKHSERAALT